MKSGGGAERRILILGLKQSGKSRLLQCFQRYTSVYDKLPEPIPTTGYNIHSVGLCGIDFHFWEGGGMCDSEWVVNHFGIPSNIDVLVWVVDSSEPSLIRASKTAFHNFMQIYDEKIIREASRNHVTYGIPIVIVASKQDKTGSVKASQIFHEMQTEVVQKYHKVYIVGTRVPDIGPRQGLWRLYEILAYSERKRCKQL
ncbi:ADP-ribosylation factor protein 3 [Mactra antiquata]